ncbi:hypothetical protein ACFVXK_36620, partial [Streptomyces sp. NPDC058157]
AALRRRIAPYLADPEPGTVAAGLAGGAAAGPAVPAARTEAAGPAGEGGRAEALAHALSVVSEAAVTTALQALALTAAGVPEAARGPAAAVALALRRFPPVEAAVHPVRTRFVWDGIAVDPGTEILAAPGWLREDADPGDAPRPASDSAFCGSPAGCPAGAFAARVAEETVRFFTETAPPALISPALAPDRIPLTLAPHTLLLALPAPGAAPPAARAAGPSADAVLARADADRLDALARGLADCAAEPGWNGDETGEAFRMRLLDHAQRCTRAAADVRAAARRLAD